MFISVKIVITLGKKKNINIRADSKRLNSSVHIDEVPNWRSISAHHCQSNSKSHSQTGTHDGCWRRTLLTAQGGDAVSLAVLLQAQLLLMQVHRGGIDSCAL